MLSPESSGPYNMGNPYGSRMCIKINIIKTGHERRVLRSGQVVCADCATRPPLYSDPFNTNSKKRSNPSPFLYQSQNTKKPKLISDQFWSSEPLYI